MARQIEMEVSIDTTKSEIKLQKLQNELKQLRKEAAQLDEGDKGFGAWAEAINQTENEMLKLKNSIKSNNVETSTSTKNFQSLGDKISSAFDGAGKKAKRFTLALFSVRSVFSIISKASREYLAENEDTSSKVAGAWSYLGNVIGPVIEKIVSWLQYGIAYLNVFLKALTGVDFLAKSIQKTTAKVNKELKKTVSSMDEIVNLDLDSGSNAPNGAGALQDIADLELNPKVVEFMEKLGNAVKTVWEWAKTAWDFLEEHFGTTGALAIVGGLALILGGKGSGLLGISGALKGIATIGTIAIGVDLLYGALTGRDLIQDLKDIKKGFDDLKSIEKDLGNSMSKSAETTETLTNAYKVLGERVDITSDQSVADFIKQIDNANASAVDSIDTALEVIKSNGYLSDSYDGANKEMEANAKQLLSNKTILETLKGQLEANRSNLDKNSQAYKNNETRIKEVDTALKKLNGYTAVATVDLRVKDSLSNVLIGLEAKIYKFTNNFGLVGAGLKKIFGYATGGFPNEGQMFIANEKGPELVGNIGNSTAVVNNNQIVESVSQGVAMAVSSVMGSNNKGNQTATYLYINGSEFAKAVYDDMNTESRRRNTNTSIRRA